MVLIFALGSMAQSYNAVSDYDQLSKLTSEQLLEKGRKYFELRNGSQAIACFRIVSDRYGMNDSRENAELSVRALNNSGCVSKFLFYDYPAAYEYFTRAYDLAEKIGYDSFTPTILVNLGDLLNDYASTYQSKTIQRQADSILNLCIQKSIQNKQWELLTTAFFNLANKNYDLDLSNYKAIFSDEIPSNTPDIEYARLLYKGIESIQKKQYPEARRYFERQPSVVNTPYEAYRDTLASYVNIAETYKRERNFSAAAAQLEKALNLTSKEDFRDVEANINRELSECYIEMGDSVKAREYRVNYLELLEAMHNSRLGNIAEMKYVSELNREANKARELAYRDRIRSLITIVIIIILLIVVVFAVFIWRKNILLHAREKSLFEKYSQMLAREAETREARESKYSRSNLNNDQRTQLVERIKKVLADPEIICKQGFSSGQLAALVDSNTTYVSQVINEEYGVSFSILLGNCRVREACRKINDSDQFDRLTIEGIANSVGFKSRTALLNAFKREVGITPSEYLRISAEEKKKKLEK